MPFRLPPKIVEEAGQYLSTLPRWEHTLFGVLVFFGTILFFASAAFSVEDTRNKLFNKCLVCMALSIGFTTGCFIILGAFL